MKKFVIVKNGFIYKIYEKTSKNGNFYYSGTLVDDNFDKIYFTAFEKIELDKPGNYKKYSFTLTIKDGRESFILSQDKKEVK